MSDEIDEIRVNDFLSSLNKLCRKHGIFLDLNIDECECDIECCDLNNNETLEKIKWNSKDKKFMKFHR